MIKRFPKGVMIYCDHCDESMGPFEHLLKRTDDAICEILANSRWLVGVAVTRRLHQCTNCTDAFKQGLLGKCEWCHVGFTNLNEPYCSPLCKKEWEDAHA